MGESDSTGGSEKPQTTGLISLMPVLDDLLDLIGRQATSNDIVGDSKVDIVKKVRSTIFPGWRM
jgi:hypothetical protein